MNTSSAYPANSNSRGRGGVQCRNGQPERPKLVGIERECALGDAEDRAWVDSFDVEDRAVDPDPDGER